MFSNNDNSRFNIFHSVSSELQSKNGLCNNLENSSFKRLLNVQNGNQYELPKHDRKISLPDYTYNYRGNSYYHFEFKGNLNLSPEKKQISEKKTKHLDLENISIIRRKIESNSLYVGFENKYGENSCYINVILHFLYFFPCINEYLIKLYQTNKDDIKFSNNNITNFNNFDFFLFLLGKTLFEYQKSLSIPENSGITILHTTELRQFLDIISNSSYKINKVADPVELLNFLFNLINKNNQKELHKYFYLNLTEEINCSQCQKKFSTKYDKDNFIYHIYVDEIMTYINTENKNIENYYGRLFQISQFISLNYFKICENCHKRMNKVIKCVGPEYPTFLLINCIWNNPKPSLKDVINFLYVLPLEDWLDNLFICVNKKKPKQGELYNLLGMILYSPGLSHYINIMFNIEKNVFVLYDDDKVKELNTIHDVYKLITAKQIKNNLNFYFYPVLLIYYKETIYDDPDTIQKNQYSLKKYNYLVEACNKIQNESKISLTDEQKNKNIMELIQAQIKYQQNFHNNNFFNNSEYDNLGCSSLYKVKEETDEEKFCSSQSIKMIIDEQSKDKNDNNINRFYKNEKSDNFNKDKTNKNINNYDNNMELEFINNNDEKKVEDQKFDNIECNKNHTNINNNNPNYISEARNYPSEKNIKYGIFFEKKNYSEFRRNNMKHATAPQKYYNKKDFFHNII